MVEYELLFEAGVHNLSIDIEVYDDHISEKDEIFVVYLNYTEYQNDKCALVVHIIDDDCMSCFYNYNAPRSYKLLFYIFSGLMFNFSSSQAMIEEGAGEYLNLSIVKIGENEPNVRVKIGLSLELVDITSRAERGIMHNAHSQTAVMI